MNNDKVEVQTAISEDDKNNLMQGMGRHLIQATGTGCNQYEHKPDCPHGNGTDDKQHAERLLETGISNVSTLPHSYVVSQLCNFRVQFAPQARELAELKRKELRTFCETFKAGENGIDTKKLTEIVKKFAETAKSAEVIDYGDNAVYYAILIEATKTK